MSLLRYGRLARFFAFNPYERDKWIEQQARLVPAGARVLDVGAGTCPYRSLFLHCDYKSQDFKQVDIESSGWTRGYGDIDYVSDITAIPVDDASFDAVLCTEVFEHVPEPLEALGEIARVLRPRGLLILTAPQRSGGHQRPFHYYGGFTPEWYRFHLPRYGLEILESVPNGGFFKAYGEESHWFATLLFPPGSHRRRLLFPIYLLLKARAMALALLGYWLDPLDRAKDFAVGHHVLARKLSSESRLAGDPQSLVNR